MKKENKTYLKSNFNTLSSYSINVVVALADPEDGFYSVYYFISA